MRTHRGNHWKANLMGATMLALALIGASWAAFNTNSARGATASAPTVGTIPESAWDPSGQIDLAKVPDFVPALSGGQVVGYIAKAQLFPETSVTAPDPFQAATALSTFRTPTATDQAAQNAKLVKTVYASDLKTVVGHMFPGVGFVPEGQLPPTTPSSPPTTASGSPTP